MRALRYESRWPGIALADIERGTQMASVAVHFLGSGDAFGSGGRFQTCFFVKSDATCFLIDCGATSLVAMKRFGVSPAEIDTVLLTHLHGDHFGGLPFLLIEADHISKRTRPLAIVGPSGTKRRLVDAMEVMFPGASRITLCYPLEVLELVPERPSRRGTITITGYVVEHECGAPPLALRIECEGRIIAYSGDTVWTESLVRAAKNADLFIAEAYTFERKTKLHMDLQTLVSHLPEISAKRLILTHMSAEMLDRRGSLSHEFAEDGKVVEL